MSSVCLPYIGCCISIYKHQISNLIKKMRTHNAVIILRLPEASKNRLREIAEAADLSMSEWLRAQIHKSDGRVDDDDSAQRVRQMIEGLP